MNKQNLIIGAIILTVTSILTRVLGFVFRVFLSNRIGAEGIGLYQLTFSLYMIFLALCSSGISVSIAKLISEHMAKNGEIGVSAIIRKSVCLTAFIGGVFGAFLFFASEPLSLYILRDVRVELSLKILAPTLPFIAVTACLNGYFYAVRKVIKPAITQVIEQVSKILLVAMILIFLKPDTVELACAATVIGLGLGEIVCCTVIGIGYLAEKKKLLCGLSSPSVNVIRRLLGVSVPIAASQTATSCFRMLENVLIVSKLKEHGSSHEAATGTYGMLKGMVLPLLLFPSSLLSAFVTTLVPEVARANASGNKKRVCLLISRVLQITTILSILIVTVFLCFSYELGLLIYNNNEVGAMLGMLSIICPFIYLEMVVVGILHAMGQQVSSLRYNLIDSVIRIVLIIIFIPHMGVQAFLWVMIASNLFTSLLNLRRLLKITSVMFRFVEWFIKPSFAALSIGILTKLFCKNILYPIMPLWMVIIIGIGIISAIYLIMMFLLGCFKSQDLKLIRKHLIPISN